MLEHSARVVWLLADDQQPERSRVWQPACESVGLATITNTTIVKDGKRKTKRTYDGPVPYDLGHSFASLLIHEGKHSIVQIAEWMGHSPATLLTHYAHVIADVVTGTPSVAGKSTLPRQQAAATASSLSGATRRHAAANLQLYVFIRRYPFFWIEPDTSGSQASRVGAAVSSVVCGKPSGITC